MFSELSLQPQYMDQTTISQFECKLILHCQSTHNRILFLTESHLHIINPNQTNKGKHCVSVAMVRVVRMKANTKNYLCVLYEDRKLEIRYLDNVEEVVQVYEGVSFERAGHYPKLHWQDEDIYVLGPNKIEIINPFKKERKFSQEDPQLSILGVAESRLMQQQRIAIIHYPNSVSFRIWPTPISQLPAPAVTQVLAISSPKYDASYANDQLHREYLLVVLDHTILRVYNMVNIKQIAEVRLGREQGETVSVTSDKFGEYLLVGFSREGRVVRNVLYRVNVKDYYKNLDYEKEVQKFFEFEVTVDVPQKLHLLSSRQLQVANTRFIFIDLFYCKHNTTKSKVEIILCTLTLNPVEIPKSILRYRGVQPEWQQAPEWRAMITSFFEMKVGINMLDFSHDSKQSKSFSLPKVNCEPNDDHRDVASKKQSQLEAKLKEKHEEISKYQQQAKQVQAKTEFKVDSVNKIEREMLGIFYGFMEYLTKDNEEDFGKMMERWGVDNFSEEYGGGYLSTKAKDYKAEFSLAVSSDNVTTDGSEAMARRQDNESKAPAEPNQQQTEGQELSSDHEHCDCHIEQITDQQQQKISFDIYLSEIVTTINRAFEPLQAKISTLGKQISRIQAVHLTQLKKCQAYIQDETEKLTNVDVIAMGYCREFMLSINERVQAGLDSYWNLIEELDGRSARGLDKVINSYGNFIDQKIRSREEVIAESEKKINKGIKNVLLKLTNSDRRNESEDEYEVEME